MPLTLDDPIGQNPASDARLIAVNNRRLREKFANGIAADDIAADAVGASELADSAVADANFAAGAPVVIATSIAGLGSTRDGKAGMVRIGSTPFDFVGLVYDGTYAKWVSPVFGYGAQVAAGLAEVSTSYATTAQADVSRTPLPAYDAHYAAGLRLQVRLRGGLHNSAGANTTFASVGLFDWSVNDNGLGTSIENSAEISAATATRQEKDSGWATYTVDPSGTHAALVAQTKVSAGTGTINDLEWVCRWVSA